MSFDSYTNSGQGQNLFQQLPIQSTRDPVDGVDFNDPGGGPYQIGRTWFNKTNENYWHYVGQGIWVLDAGGSGPLIKIGVPAGTSPITPDANGLVNFTSTSGTITITGSAGGLGAQDINFDVAGGSVLEKFNVDASTPPGTNPVVPTGGIITIEGGATYATGTRANPIRTNSLAASTIDLQIQLAGSNAASSTPNDFGVAQFDSNQFSVTSGFVQLKGGGVNPALTKLAVQTGTSPVVPDSTGQITFNGATVAAGTHPVRTDGTGTNTVALEVQQASTVAPTPANNNAIGLASYNNTQFTIDSTSGMVSLFGSVTVSSFSAYLNANVTNATGDGTDVLIPLNATVFNVGSNFSTGSGKYTAPVTGTYQLCATISISNIGAGHTTGRYFVYIKNSGGTTKQILEFAQQSPAATENVNNNFTISGSMVCQMNATDTAQMDVVVNGSTKTITLNGSASITASPFCCFSGTLLA